MALQIATSDPGFAKVVETWPRLPAKVQQQILALTECTAVEASPPPLVSLSGTSGDQGSRGDSGVPSASSRVIDTRVRK
jgi:hypothetical protein